jgi:hypothetical protein
MTKELRSDTYTAEQLLTAFRAAQELSSVKP